MRTLAKSNLVKSTDVTNLIHLDLTRTENSALSVYFPTKSLADKVCTYIMLTGFKVPHHSSAYKDCIVES